MNARNSIIGKVVKITWKVDHSNLWQRFEVLAIEHRFMRIKGRSGLDGQYDGYPIWVPTRDVDCMEEIEP